MNDKVKRPEHYQLMDNIEVFDVIDFVLGTMPPNISHREAYTYGNIIKYILRAWRKGGIEDVEKAYEYMGRFIKAAHGQSDTIPIPPSATETEDGLTDHEQVCDEEAEWARRQLETDKRLAVELEGLSTELISAGNDILRFLSKTQRDHIMFREMRSTFAPFVEASTTAYHNLMNYVTANAPGWEVAGKTKGVHFRRRHNIK